MLTLRRAEERGRADFGWLDSRHSFSFGEYYDPRHMGYGPLRVINDDRVAPGAGFGMHAHRDMEILTYVLEGALEHKDSLGSGSVIRPGDVQHMSAGTGIRHSEFNPSATEPVHFLQIWLLPERPGLSPAYAERHFPLAGRRGRLQLFAARDGRDGALPIRQDVDLHAAVLAPGESVRHTPAEGRKLWLQVARGSIELNGLRLAEGDGVAIEAEPLIEMTGIREAELLLFDMAG